MASVPPLEFSDLDSTLARWEAEDKDIALLERVREGNVIDIRDWQRREEIAEMFDACIEMGSQMRDPALVIRRPK